MSFARPVDPHMQGPRYGAHLAMGLSAACTLVVLCTVWFLPVRDSDRSIALALAGGSMVVALALVRLPWERLPMRSLLLFPAVGLAAMTAGALLTHGVAASYTGFFTVAFVFLGLTQTVATNLLMVVLATPAWILCSGGFTPTDEAKLPVAMGIWLLVGQTLASRTARTSERAGELLAAASTDPLTGFLNRRELPRLLELLQPGDAVVLLDLDHFKQVNDEYGHHVGDLVLADFGKTVRESLRAEDVALRYGGDEVLLMLPRASEGAPDMVLTRLQARWNDPSRPTFSAGIAVHDPSSPVPTARRADQALYAAKNHGRDRWTYDKGTGQRHLRALT